MLGRGVLAVPRALPVPTLSLSPSLWGLSCSILGFKGELTSQREEAQAAHAQEMLQSKILHLEQKKSGRGVREGLHGGLGIAGAGCQGTEQGQGCGCRVPGQGARAESF